MKIFVLHGQNHKGSTYHMAQLFLEGFSKEEKVQEFFLPKDLNHFCTGCYQCVTDEKKCPFYEEKSILTSAMEEADLLVFTTPVYCMHASASLKAFLDLTFTYWMSHKPRKSMFHKKAVVLSTGAGGGMKSALKDVKTALNHWGVSSVFTYGVAVAAMNWDGVSTKKKERIKKAMETLSLNVKRKALVKTSLKVKILFLIMRLMQQKGFGSSKEERIYWEEKGWLAKNRPWIT